MSAMFCTRVFFLEWSTPPTRCLLLHHAVISFVESCLSELRVIFLMKLSSCLATWYWIVIISKIFDELSHLWYACPSLVSLWRQVSSWCFNVGKLPIWSEVRHVGPSSRIPIVEYLWVWQVRSIICCGGQQFCPSKSDSMIPFMRRCRQVLYQHCSISEYYMTQSFQDIWSSLWMLQIHLKLWYCLSIFIHHMLCPRIVYFFLILFIFRYGNLGVVYVNFRRRMTWEFEESRWSKEYALIFVRFGSAANVHFQYELVKVVEYK